LQFNPRLNGNEILDEETAPRTLSKTLNEEYRLFEIAQDIGITEPAVPQPEDPTDTQPLDPTDTLPKDPTDTQPLDPSDTLPKDPTDTQPKEPAVPLEARKPLVARKLSSSIEDVKKIMRGEIKAENFTGLSTGFSCMDKLYRPVRGEITVVTAPPGSGKSEWLLSLMINMAQVHGWRFGACMFEHKRPDFLQILMEKFLVAPRTEIARLEEAQLARFWDDFYLRYVCLIGDTFSEELSIKEILEAARHHADNHKDDGGLHGLIIDPYNYITKEPGNETEFVAALLREVKHFAAEYNCHVWIVVHPTKNSNTAKGESPSLYDCCGSAHWYNMCDNGIVLQRNKDPSVGSTKMVKVQVAKVRNRFAGEVGTVTLHFDTRTRCYSETAS